MSPTKPGIFKGAKGPRVTGADRPVGTKLTVTETRYADGDLVPTEDGVYMAVGPSRPMAFNPHHFITTIQPND